MTIVLNFVSEFSVFLCRDHPIVSKVTATNMVKGCSKAKKRLPELATISATPTACIALKTGDIRYQLKPINNCMYAKIRVDKPNNKSMGWYSFCFLKPIHAFITVAIHTKSNR